MLATGYVAGAVLAFGEVTVELVERKGQLLLGEEEELGKMGRQQNGGDGGWSVL